MGTTYDRIIESVQFQAPKSWLRLQTIEMHAGGEPLRVILGGLPVIEGSNVLEQRRFMLNNHDQIRKLLMYEPRGHMDMYGCVLLPPADAAHDFAILFIHNEGYSTMCGHAIIAIAKLAVEMGWVDRVEPVTSVTIEAPCGLIKAYAKVENGSVTSTYFDCVPSFVLTTNDNLEVPGVGNISLDIAYGGAFYAYVDARQLDLELIPENTSRIVDAGTKIKHAVTESRDIIHPIEEDLSFLYGTIFIDESGAAGVDSRNVCIFAAGEVDRSPTGSGVCGRMAIHYQKGEIAIGEEMKIESIVGSIFTGSVVESLEYGPYQAVVPRVEGSAFVTGTHEFVLDPKDPFQEGFLLR